MNDCKILISNKIMYKLILVFTPQYLYKINYVLLVDLVTLDDLSAEAMLESSQRVEQLADLFRRRVEPLPDPGPPQTLPGKPRTASVPIQVIAIIL